MELEIWKLRKPSDNKYKKLLEKVTLIIDFLLGIAIVNISQCFISSVEMLYETGIVY